MIARNKRMKRAPKKQERDTAKKLDGRRHAASGSVWWEKGDGSTDDILFECKLTGGASIILRQKTLKMACRQAISTGRMPLIAVRFTSVSDPFIPHDWIVAPLDDFAEMYRAYKAAKRNRNEGKR